MIIRLGDRRYRIRGLEKNTSYNVLKVNVMLTCGEAMHVDSFDLYAMKPRGGFIRQAAFELGITEAVIKKDLAKVLLKLELLQDAQIQKAMKPEADAGPDLTAAEQAEALALLQSKDLLERIVTDFERCGVVGESTNKLVGYLSAVSRKLDKPLAVIVQSTSAAGKSTLMDAVLDLIPEEERVQYSAMTGQSLFYMGEGDLKHKILAIAEEEGVQQAAYALKLLQSQGELTIASTGKDPTTGKLVTEEYRVEGPVMLFLTTTAIEIDEELLNRCIVLTVNESREQTRAIHALQRKRRTLDGLLAKAEGKRIIHVHRNAQRLLRPLQVVNPYAQELTFLDDHTRTRRDHEKYLTLIESIALLHQYQREVKQLAVGSSQLVESKAGAQLPTNNGEPATIEYIEVTLDDIAMANKLAHEVLGRSLDELAPQTRRLLGLICAMVEDKATALEMHRTDFRFSRRDVREYTGWGNTQLKVHLARLVELELLVVHRMGAQRFAYELVYDGPFNEAPHLCGLIDPQKLTYDSNRSGQKANQSAPGRGAVGHQSGTGRNGSKPAITQLEGIYEDETAETHISVRKTSASQRSRRLAAKGA